MANSIAAQTRSRWNEAGTTRMKARLPKQIVRDKTSASMPARHRAVQRGAVPTGAATTGNLK
jgi:hypothetical protein